MYNKILLVILLILMLTSCTINFNTPSSKEDNLSNGNINEETVNDPITKTEEISHFGSDDDVYRINITTNGKEFPSSLTNYIDGSIKITEQNTSIVIKDTTNMQIKLRGNSTSGPDKKPFKIKFDKAESLFGLEAAKDWVLMANYFDKTDIRNYLAHLTANKFETLGFQPSSIFVDVYMNNKYQGLYMLCEQIEANKGRVDIENNFNENGISSFLIEADTRARDEYSGYEGSCYINLGGYAMRFKYPSANDYLKALSTNEQTFIDDYEKNINWATTYLNNAYSALLTNDYNKFEKYFDIESFIDYYLIQELFKNVDVGSTSQFYVINQQENKPKISCGPVWDFDISLGVVDNSQSDIYSYYTNTELYVRNVDQFYRNMFQNPTFIQKVKERYKEIRSVLYEVFDEISFIKKALTKAQSRNMEKWPLPSQRTTWIEIYAMSNTYFNLPTLSRHYRYLKTNLEERFAVLDHYYL